MSLDQFIETRFADPITSISQHDDGMAFGSMTGRLIYITFSDQQEYVIFESLEENVRGIHFEANSNMFVCVGDQYGLILNCNDLVTEHSVGKKIQHQDNRNRWGKSREELDQHEETKRLEHSMKSCDHTQTLMWKHKICLIQSQDELSPINNFSIHVTDLLKNFTVNYEQRAMAHYSVAFDFRDNIILFMVYNEDKTKTLKMYDTEEKTEKTLYTFPAKYGYISHAKLVHRTIIYVHNHTKIMMFDIDRNEIIDKYCANSTQILAMYCSFAEQESSRQGSSGLGGDEPKLNLEEEKELVKDQRIPDLQVITLDKSCNVKLWKNGACVETIKVNALSGLPPDLKKKDLFSMGYPYMIHYYKGRIAISSDYGILLVQSKWMQSN
eukprot:CAMPEP_0115019792 /NCGR_PEP_ID=MMETSP0216-20121206/29681_1 /TAXON_ID=223996 /ORGANISM="Protocruzia adherens, Strain Boccale" /LENGTH=381 /DNA_ID=CAMNT_0002391383 /DNA_START=15 /DNA_END=1160 /DNA_ORIENTATION=+